MDDPLLEYTTGAINDNSRRYLHKDHQGSIVGMSDSHGNATAYNTYDAFGIPYENNQGRFSYTGQIYLPELKMYHYKARVYDPKLGRFLQTDPVGYEDQMNLYAYVGNDPMTKNDPTGMFDQCGNSCNWGQGWTDNEWSQYKQDFRYWSQQVHSQQHQSPSWPTDHHRVTSGFSLSRVDPVTGATSRPHTAIDIANPQDDPVYSILSGKVVKVGHSQGAGNYIKVEHGLGLETSYSHTGALVSEGDIVLQGELIGTSDSSGRIYGAHLHFVVRKNGKRIRPCTVVECP